MENSKETKGNIENWKNQAKKRKQEKLVRELVGIGAGSEFIPCSLHSALVVIVIYIITAVSLRINKVSVHPSIHPSMAAFRHVDSDISSAPVPLRYGIT